jgi:tRNA wybutosine-synthesizing protein 1
MKEKQQRTVYRMTLVKSWNMDEVTEYADLIEEGQPDFIEIKAVTYCGKSDASSLTMENVPWHHEVCKYAEAIVDKMKSRNSKIVYGLAAEHQHSCCILIAREDRFKVNDEWHTWIDYPKFHQLIGDYYASGGEKKFVSTDYMAATPPWALYQSSERGFDPLENRWKRNKAGELIERDYKSSDSGCG